MRKQLFSFLFASLFSVLGYGQITIDESITAQELVEDVLINSSCAEVSNIESSTGVDFGDVNGISFFSANGSDFPFEEGILLMSGDVQQAPGPNLTTQSNGGWPGDADLEANTTATNTNNASFIEFNFTPFIEQISFDFIMASEEYDQNFECTFSDAFAFILTDVTTGDVQNLAVIPGTTIPIEVTNIRPEVPGQCAAVNEEFFDRYNFLPFNDENAAATNFNGQTVPLTAMADVTAGNPYTIKLVVADQGDSAFDIGVFLEAGSFNIGTTDLGDDILVANGNAACEGDTITLNAEDPDAVSYMWFMDGVEIVGETNPTLDVTLPGVYSVVVALSNTDCVIEDEVVVEFITPDDVELGDDIVGCEGDTVTIDTGFADGIASYAWFFNSAILIDELNPTLEVTEAGEYAVTVTFNSGCSFSDTITVSFETSPIIELGDTINSCLENPTTLDATPSNIDPADATYSWTLDGVIIAGETNPTLDITQQGVYEVTVTSGPCVITDSVTVNPLTLLFELGDDFNTCFEETVILDASPTNIDPAEATYEWSLNGTIIAGETAPMLTITEAGTYDVTVTFGICSNTDTITVIQANPDGSLCVEPEECPTIEVDAGEDLIVDCDNPCVDLNATVVAPFTNTSSYRIDQTECVIPITGGTPTNIVVDDTWSDVIDLPFTFTFYQNDYTSIIVGANGQISFDTSLAGGFNDWNIDPGQTIPNDDQATFPFNTIYGAFHDINPGTNADPDAINFFVSGVAPFRAFVLNFDMVPQFSCTDLLTSQQIIIYETVNIIDVNIINKPICDTWNDGLATLAILGNDNTEFAVPPGRNTGAWEAIDENWRFVPDGDEDEDTIFAWTDEDGNVLSNDLTFNVCPTETTTYTSTVTFTNPDGSTTTISDDVTVTSNVVNFNVDLGGDEVFCDVDSFEIIPTITGDMLDNPSYLWSTNETTETIVVTTSGTYSVEIDAGGGCIETDEITITFSTSPTLDLGEDVILCNDETFTITPVIAGDNLDGLSYDWSTGETTETITVNTSGTISLTLTNAEGCFATDNIVITIESPIGISVGEDFTTCREFPNTLTAVSEDPNVTYEWFLNGDIITGETSSTLDFVVPQTAVGTQEYTVVITSALGCTSSDTVEVSLFDVGNCVISEGISPDDTPGFNDTLDLEFLAARSGIDVLQIYNRLGALVYEQNDYVNQWRGQTDNGNDLPTGTYFYVLNLETEDSVYGRQATGWIYINRGE